MDPRFAVLETKRLLLRLWRDSDLEPFAAMNADPEVMLHFPKVMTREESDGMAARIRRDFETRGFGLWAIEIKDLAPFAGFAGLSVPTFEASFMPCVEVGWRVARSFWNKGYATEGAEAALKAGFRIASLPEIVSFTVPANRPSRRVMEKLGLRRDPAEDFEHPKLPVGHPLRRHVLYRITRDAWMERQR